MSQHIGMLPSHRGIMHLVRLAWPYMRVGGIACLRSQQGYKTKLLQFDCLIPAIHVVTVARVSKALS